MHYKTEVLLWSDGIIWSARLRNGEVFSAGEITMIDDYLKKAFIAIFKINEGDSVSAEYRFDVSVIPEWIRQYSDHYFNRIVEFNY